MAGILINSLVPIFVGLLLGYAAGLCKIVDNKNVSGLVSFLMTFALPCSLFVTIARTPHALLWGQAKAAIVLAIVYVAVFVPVYFVSRTALGPAMNYRDVQSVRTHDLLEIDSKRFLSCQASAPEWVAESLQRTPFLVVRRGLVTEQMVTVGVRGVDRNQRWAAMCPLNLVKNILAPPQLLKRRVPKTREDAIPAFRALNFVKERWRAIGYSWGPGGSVGFELAAGEQIAKPESDLDLVIYATERITQEMAKSLYAQTLNLPVAVDVRVEAPLCGFSLKEFAWRNSGKILLRTSNGIMLGTDPWGDEVPIPATDHMREGG